MSGHLTIAPTLLGRCGLLHGSPRAIAMTAYVSRAPSAPNWMPMPSCVVQRTMPGRIIVCALLGSRTRTPAASGRASGRSVAAPAASCTTGFLEFDDAEKTQRQEDAQGLDVRRRAQAEQSLEAALAVNGREQGS